MIPESICEQLRAEGARVISLTLLGSQRFGFPTPSSDEDYVGLYQWPLEDYLGLRTRRASYEMSLDACTQVKWYELRNYLRHVEVGKPDLFRCLYASPQVSNPEVFQHIAKAVLPWYNPRLEWKSAAAWTRKLRSFFAEGGADSKEFCHWAYRALAMNYVKTHEYCHHPLINITDLVVGTGLEEEVRLLVEQRASGRLCKREDFGAFSNLANQTEQNEPMPGQLSGYVRGDLGVAFRDALWERMVEK